MNANKQRKIIGFGMAFLLTLSCFFVFNTRSQAVEAFNTAVETVNIGIQPFDYKRMVSTKAENKYEVRVEVNGRAALDARIHVRGNGTKEIGMVLPTKRLPLELMFQNAADFSELIANTCVKFCNTITPFELMAQHVAYDMFTSLGIPTPAHSFALIQYNDVDFGVYFAMEDINDEFLAKHFSAPYGSLYKGAPGDSTQRFESSKWFGDLRAVSDRGSERIVALLDALDRGEGYEDYLDVDEVMRFLSLIHI